MTDPDCHYNDGEHCKKGLPGTKCEVVGCMARISDKRTKFHCKHYDSINRICYKRTVCKGQYGVEMHEVCLSPANCPDFKPKQEKI